MASKARPDQSIRKCRHCGWTYIEFCDCRSKLRPRRRPTSDAARWQFLRDRKVRFSAWHPSGVYCLEMSVGGTWVRAEHKSLDRAMDRLMRAVLQEEASRAK